VLTPGSFILGSLDDVTAFCGFRGDHFPLGAVTGNLEFCLEGRGYPIGLLLAAQGSGFIQALLAFGGKSAG
jgi:hypothetical protein